MEKDDTFLISIDRMNDLLQAVFFYRFMERTAAFTYGASVPESDFAIKHTVFGKLMELFEFIFINIGK